MLQRTLQRHLIFDFDGVIGDTFEDNFTATRELHPGLTREEFIDHHRGNVYEHPRIRFTQKTTEEYYEKYDAVLQKHLLAESVVPLRRLGTSYRLHIVSSNCEGPIKRVLQETGIDHHFVHVLGKETHHSKVEKFAQIAEAESFILSSSLFITDTLGDLLEAKKVGLPTIGVTFGYHHLEYLEEGEPNYIAHTWAEVLVHIDKHFAETFYDRA